MKAEIKNLYFDFETNKIARLRYFLYKKIPKKLENPEDAKKIRKLVTRIKNRLRFEFYGDIDGVLFDLEVEKVDWKYRVKAKNIRVVKRVDKKEMIEEG